MHPSRSMGKYRKWIAYGLPALAISALTGVAAAQQDDLAEGVKLYVSQCKVCHGSVSAADQTQGARVPPEGLVVRLAMQHTAPTVRTDVSAPLAPAGGFSTPDPDRLAFAPPFGPNLKGVYGRPAGTVKGFSYSKTFLSTLQGMEWNEAALDVWTTNPQAWVPGVYMFYKQPDPEIRRKIILYLKANP